MDGFMVVPGVKVVYQVRKWSANILPRSAKKTLLAYFKSIKWTLKCLAMRTRSRSSLIWVFDAELKLVL